MAINVNVYKRKLSSGNIALYLVDNIEGKRHFETLGMVIKKNDSKERKKELLEIAEEKRAERQLALISDGTRLSQRKKSSQSFIEYWENYLDELYRENGNKASSNYHGFQATLLHFKNFLKYEFNGKRNIAFKEIDESLIENFIIYLKTTARKKSKSEDLENPALKLSPNSVDRYFNKLSAILHAAVKSNILNYNPANNIKKKPKPVQVEKVYLTYEELKKLIKTPCDYIEIKRAFIFSCLTGLRLSDIKKLTWGEIRENKLHFRQQKTQGFDYLPLHQNAIEILEEKLSSNIKPMNNVRVFDIPSSNWINDVIKKWSEKAGIDKKVTYHTSRHTYATLALSNGVDLYIVSKLLGHKDIETTQIYAKIINKRLDQAVSKLPVFDLAQ